MGALGGRWGVEAVRGILSHPDLELVGVKVYSEAKAGTDAGVLAGRDPVGVTAAIDVDTASVDAVVYAPRHPSVDDAVAILRRAPT